MSSLQSLQTHIYGSGHRGRIFREYVSGLELRHMSGRFLQWLVVWHRLIELVFSSIHLCPWWQGQQCLGRIMSRTTQYDKFNAPKFIVVKLILLFKQPNLIVAC
jgi:hypothetical protein